MSHVCRFCRAHIFKFFEKGGKISSSSFLGMPRGILKVVCVCPSIEHSIPYPTRVPVRRTFDTVPIRNHVSVRRIFDTVFDTVCLSVNIG